METIAKYTPRVEVVTDSEQLAHRSVDIFVDRAKKAIEEKGVFKAVSEFVVENKLNAWCNYPDWIIQKTPKP